MGSPTDKEILKAFPDLDAAKAKDLAVALARPDELSESDDDFLKAVDEAMDAANDALGGHGVESVSGKGSNLGKYWRDTILLYVNLGDTYDTTICFDPDEEDFFVGSWGEFLEEWEQSEEDEEDGEDEESEDEEGDGKESEEEDAETEEAE